MKGISAVVAGTIMVLLITIGVIPLIMLYISTAQEVYSTYSFSKSISEYRELEEIRANLSNDILTIANVGAIPVDLTYIVLKDKTGECDIVMRIHDIVMDSPEAVVSASNMVIDGGREVVKLNVNGYMKINISMLGLSDVSDVCSIASSRGGVIEVKKAFAALAERARAVVATPITLDAATLSNRTDIIVSESQIQPATPDSPGTGMRRISADGSYYTALTRFFHARSTGYQSLNVIGVGDGDSCNVSFNNIYIGYSPEWSRNRVGPPRYNILITGYEPIEIKIPKQGASVRIFGNNTYIQNYLINKTDYYIIRLSQGEQYVPYRIKILDYIPSGGDLVLYYDKDYDGDLDKLVNKEALGYWWLYSGQAMKTSLISLFQDLNTIEKGCIELNGTASEVIVYLEAWNLGLFNINESSYEPYIFSADVDGNGYPEFVFVTEDESCSVSSLDLSNDVGHEVVSGLFYQYVDIVDNTWADDWSLRKFLVNLTGYMINGNDIAFVQVAIRAYIHDNFYDDPSLIGGYLPLTNEVSDPSHVLFGVYLVNSSTGEIVSSREWTFAELDQFENTFPPNTNFVVFTATLAVPRQGIYFLALGFQDPYQHTDNGKDDGDFIIALEVASITYYARS